MSDDPTGLLALAAALHQRGELAAAEPLYRRVLADAPRNADALHLLGVLTAQQGRPADAVPLIEAAIAEAPREAAFHANLARAHKAAGHAAAALVAFTHSIALGTADAGVFNDRGNLLLDLGRLDDALTSFSQAIALRPNYAEAHGNRGNALRALNRAQEALESYDRAIALRPDFADAHSNRGNVLQELDRHEDALASYNRALALRPDHADALANRGVTLRALGRYAEALDSYDRALFLRPDHVAAHTNRALCLLQTGDWARGWVEHEWRWRSPLFAARAALFPSPPWLGETALTGQTILLHAEQGFGDTLQFCRYVPLVAARGARVILEAARPLTRLLRTLDGVAELIAEGDHMPHFDRHCPLLSLPLAFKTTPETVPPPARLSVDAAQIAAWWRRLAVLLGRHVGLVWEGSWRKQHPEGRAVDRRRSFTLDQFAALGRISGVSFVSLQKGAAAVQTASPPLGLTVHDFTEELADFADTAALISVLDLVITVDTAVAHLAGTLGRPVWILTQFDSDWRWLLNRNDTPWYPSAQLFRQPRLGDWDAVIAEVTAALETFAAPR